MHFPAPSYAPHAHRQHPPDFTTDTDIWGRIEPQSSERKRLEPRHVNDKPKRHTDITDSSKR